LLADTGEEKKRTQRKAFEESSLDSIQDRAKDELRSRNK